MSHHRSLGCLVSMCCILLGGAARAQTSPPLPTPEICSVFLSPQQNEFCNVDRGGGPADGPATLTLSLTATAGPVNVAGYKITETQNYNGTYLGPLVELRPGDLFKVRFLNALSPAGIRLGEHQHGHAAGGGADITNLHTHGLIVTPNNARDAEKGDGDNIYAMIGRGQLRDYNIKIPTALPATILDLPSGIIPHPSGLYWYHAHLHGISAAQLAGGMSGLLSIGRADENVVGADAAATDAIRAKTDVSHLLLRDIQITSSTPPDQAKGSPADWLHDEDPKLCAGTTVAASDRPGFCTGSKPNNIWLFTVNGERFPQITVGSGRNQLLRIANTSASATYVLSLIDPAAPGTRIPFELVSVDGVVPTTKPGTATTPVAPSADAIRLMPASRAEIYIRNDQPSPTARRLVLRTEGLHTGVSPTDGDDWPDVHLAQIILEPSPAAVVAASMSLAAHLVRAAAPRARPQAEVLALPPAIPPGCIRDMVSTKREHRKITFTQPSDTSWAIRTQIMAPPDLTGLHSIDDFAPVPGTSVGPIPFEKYLKDDGSVNWDGPPKHVCVSLKTGHGQLWELYNPTQELHNFHIHQSKFRIATADDLKRYGINPQGIVNNTTAKLLNARNADDLYIWHDTIPVESGDDKRVFIIINFEAEEQLGKFVFHCHILEHEDSGLMAPVEVIP